MLQAYELLTCSLRITKQLCVMPVASLSIAVLAYLWRHWSFYVPSFLPYILSSKSSAPAPGVALPQHTLALCSVSTLLISTTLCTLAGLYLIVLYTDHFYNTYLTCACTMYISTGTGMNDCVYFYTYACIILFEMCSRVPIRCLEC